MEKKTRRLGDGYSLALRTGHGTHMTLVYFPRLRRGFEQQLAQSIAAGYFEEHKIERIHVNYGDVVLERSIAVEGFAENDPTITLAQIAKDLRKLMQDNGLEVSASEQLLHVDPRGNAKLDRIIASVNNWNC